jgi:hypothetical protein
MSLTIDLKPELEAQLQEAVAKSGSDTNTFVVQALEERLRRNSYPSTPAHLSQEESRLLQKINQGLQEAIWQEYHALIAMRRAEILTPREHTRLIALSDHIEETHAERMASVAELARLRQVSLKTLMEQLGIKPRKV